MPPRGRLYTSYRISTLSVKERRELKEFSDIYVCHRKRHRSSWKLAYFHYTLRTINGPKLAAQILDFEKLWSKQICFVFLFENGSKFSYFCLDLFSLVSRHFSVLSSLSGRIRPHLAPETQNFCNIDEKTWKNLDSKSEKCNFDQWFQPRNNNLIF